MRTRDRIAFCAVKVHKKQVDKSTVQRSFRTKFNLGLSTHQQTKYIKNSNEPYIKLNYNGVRQARLQTSLQPRYIALCGLVGFIGSYG